MANKVAFTLAETLITLLVISVVAVLTIPALIQQIGGYTLQKQKDVFSKKFSDGLGQMRVDEKLAEKYSTTVDFVNEMQKYFRISAVCDKNNLKGCFPDTFTAKAFLDGKETAFKTIKTSEISTTRSLVEKSSYDTDVIGLVFADGTKMLITYDTECSGVTSSDTEGNLYSCFGYIADVNADKSPNEWGKDIVSDMPLIKNWGLDFDILDNKIYSKSEFGCVNNPSVGYCDYWLGAKQFCESKGAKLPTPDELDDMAEKMYGNANCSFSSKNGRIFYRYCNESNKNQQLWSFVNGAGFWTSQDGFFRAFNSNNSDFNNDSNWRKKTNDGGVVICVE